MKRMILTNSWLCWNPLLSPLIKWNEWYSKIHDLFSRSKRQLSARDIDDETSLRCPCPRVWEGFMRNFSLTLQLPCIGNFSVSWIFSHWDRCKTPAILWRKISYIYCGIEFVCFDWNFTIWLVQIMAWQRSGDWPLSWPMMLNFADSYIHHPVSIFLLVIDQMIKRHPSLEAMNKFWHMLWRACIDIKAITNDIFTICPMRTTPNFR